MEKLTICNWGLIGDRVKIKNENVSDQNNSKFNFTLSPIINITHGAVSNARYLHDGRARTLVEAIEWHDDEAAKSRTQFEALSTADRNALLNFLRTL